MWYQLVLITNLGAITPLVTFPTWDECVREKARITKTQQHSAECLPTQSPEQLKAQMQGHLKMMNELIQELQKTQR
jgi:hypothetical protein